MQITKLESLLRMQVGEQVLMAPQWDPVLLHPDPGFWAQAGLRTACPSQRKEPCALGDRSEPCAHRRQASGAARLGSSPTGSPRPL